MERAIDVEGRAGIEYDAVRVEEEQVSGSPNHSVNRRYLGTGDAGEDVLDGAGRREFGRLAAE